MSHNLAIETDRRDAALLVLNRLRDDTVHVPYDQRIAHCDLVVRAATAFRKAAEAVVEAEKNAKRIVIRNQDIRRAALVVKWTKIKDDFRATVRRLSSLRSWNKERQAECLERARELCSAECDEFAHNMTY